MKRVEMQCADENFAVRMFVSQGSDKDGHEDFACEHCGWLQQSAEAGAAELCRSATWHDEASYRRYAEKARQGGFAVPDLPASLQVVFRASCYMPAFEGRELPTAEAAVAFAESGTGGVVTKLVNGKTAAGWVFDQGQWHQIDVLFSGRRLNVERPN